jgi:integrase
MGQQMELIVASVGSDKNGHRRILFYAPDGSRKTIRLGKCSKKDAESFKTRVESLLSWRILGRQPDGDTSEWLASLDRKLVERIERAGLVDPVEPAAPAAQTTLESFLVDFVKRNGVNKKPSTLIVWGQSITMLNEYMPKGILLAGVTTGHAKYFAEQLRARPLANSTVSKRVGFARQFFQDAVDWELIDRNPFGTVKVAASSAKSNVDVPREWVDAIMKHCDTTWQVIVGLSRYGGLRCPSETLSLTWGDVDFENGRMSVPEPKVEHHEGRGIRSVPLFPELRTIMERAFNEASERGTYPSPDSFVVNKPAYREAAMTERGWANSNLRTQFLKIVRRAGITPWKRIFHSMRASRQTELERTFPRHVVCAWLGNTSAVAERNYLLVTQADFDAAAGVTSEGGKSGDEAAPKAARSDAKPARNTAPQVLALETQENEKTPENTGETDVSTGFSGVPKVEVNGLEPLSKTRGKQASGNEAARNAARSELLALIETLDDMQVGDLVAIARGMASQAARR